MDSRHGLVWGVLGGILLAMSMAQAGTYSGGTGEPNNPYQIATAQDLIDLGNEPNDYDKHFILTADIDLDPNLPGGEVFDHALVAPDTDDAKSGFQGEFFTGYLNGQGHSILNLHIEDHDYLGLIGGLSQGTIANLTLESVNINGNNQLGAIAGVSYAGVILYCYSTGRLSGDDYIGGIAGDNRGKITDYSPTVGGVIKACSSECNCSGEESVGGLIGSTTGIVTTCFSKGKVSGRESVGGLVGFNGMKGVVQSCYSSSTVSGYMHVGGLVGYNRSGNVNSSYSIGSVLSSTGDDYLIGGLIGTGAVGINSSFWDMNSSGLSTSYGGIGLTTQEMQVSDTYLNAGWDFLAETENGANEIWFMSENEYPRLWWELLID